MNVEIGAEAAQFPEKEYINEIFLAVREWNNFTLYPTCISSLPYVSCKQDSMESTVL